MAFLETPRFPDIAAGLLVGGEEFLTQVVITTSGAEKRNSMWTVPRRRYRIGNAQQHVRAAMATAAFFRLVGGRRDGFRVKAPFDWSASVAEGLVGTGVGTGTAAYQLRKSYGYGITADIKKPVVGTVSVFKNGSLVTPGAGAGQYALDTTTGIVTFVAPFPTGGDTLTWSGEYDIPVRFDTDWLQIGHDGGLLQWQGVSLTELRL